LSKFQIWTIQPGHSKFQIWTIQPGHSPLNCPKLAKVFIDNLAGT
jgi:hypothetical protein